MATEGAVLESFPDSPVTTAALSSLEATDAIRTAIPLLSEAHDGQEVSDQVVVQPDTVAIVASYTDGEGWTALLTPTVVWSLGGLSVLSLLAGGLLLARRRTEYHRGGRP